MAMVKGETNHNRHPTKGIGSGSNLFLDQDLSWCIRGVHNFTLLEK